MMPFDTKNDISLPRRARDKHRESAQNRDAFSFFVQAGAALTAEVTRRISARWRHTVAGWEPQSQHGSAVAAAATAAPSVAAMAVAVRRRVRLWTAATVTAAAAQGSSRMVVKTRTPSKPLRGGTPASASASLSLSLSSLDAKVGATTKTAMTAAAAAAASAAASRLATPVGQERQQHEEEEGPQQQQQQRLWTQSGSYPCTSCCASAARPLGPGVAYVNDSRPGCGGALDDSGCSYNGEAQPDGSCVCLPQWKGPHCAQLNLMPTPRDAVRTDTSPISHHSLLCIPHTHAVSARTQSLRHLHTRTYTHAHAHA
eukprot:COSAG06_NODE_10882_length_1588_cov_1.883566_1_plen_314_part_00